MHSFWTLLRAEFSAEVLSKILFSGRFPRAVAFLLVFFVGSWIFCFWIIKSFYRLVRFIVLRRSVRIQRSLKRVCKVASKFGDASEPYEDDQHVIGVFLTNPRFSRDVDAVFVAIDRKTEKLYIVLQIRGERHPLTHPFLAQFCASDKPFDMHGEFAPYLYHQLRLNYL